VAVDRGWLGIHDEEIEGILFELRMEGVELLIVNP
jgi:hypothetical protein